MTELTIDQALQQGVEAHKAGQVQEADRLYTAILKAQPKHPDANHNMGVLAVGVGKVEQALPFFKTALEANPATAQFWLSYIDALIKLDQLTDAKAVLDQAKSKGAKGDGFDKLEQRLKEAGEGPLAASKTPAEAPPQQPNILDSLKLDQAIKLAKKKAKDGSPEEAKRIYQDILATFPKNKRASDGLKRLAGKSLVKASKAQDPPQDQLQSLINLYSQGQLQQALKQAETLVKQFPQSAILFNIQGAVLKGLGQLDASIEAYKKALAIKPDYAEAYLNMGVTFREQAQLEKAIAAYNKALAIKPDYADAYNNMGVALKEQGNLEEAIEAYHKAITIKSDYADAHLNMFIILQYQDNLEEAIDAGNKALAIKPDYAEAHRYLSILKNYAPEDEQFAQCQSLDQDESLSDQDRCHLSFALAKMFEDIGNLGKAFVYLTKGNALRKKLLGYSIEQDKELFTQLKIMKHALMKHALEPQHHAARIVPIFILGMPRSGTTLVEQIVSAHSQVTGAGELNYVLQFGTNLATGLTAPDEDMILGFRKRYLVELAKKADGLGFVTDKMPQNFLFIPLICAAFPEAKIIHVQREAAAICWSNFKHYFASKDLGYSCNLADTVKYYSLYTDLMRFWQKTYGSRIYNIDYDKLTESQEPETRRLIEYLGLNWEDTCLAPQNNKRSVKTASQQQVRKKVYKGSS
ncbi:tetratricopeptide repeat protein, partial [bacterium]|nr:tetratricopeptide repeat protein [bacterium]